MPVRSIDQSPVPSRPISNSNPSATLVLINSTEILSNTQFPPVLTTLNITSKCGSVIDCKLSFGKLIHDCPESSEYSNLPEPFRYELDFIPTNPLRIEYSGLSMVPVPELEPEFQFAPLIVHPFDAGLVSKSSSINPSKCIP